MAFAPSGHAGVSAALFSMGAAEMAEKERERWAKLLLQICAANRSAPAAAKRLGLAPPWPPSLPDAFAPLVREAEKAAADVTAPDAAIAAPKTVSRAAAPPAGAAGALHLAARIRVSARCSGFAARRAAPRSGAGWTRGARQEGRRADQTVAVPAAARNRAGRPVEAAAQTHAARRGPPTSGWRAAASLALGSAPPGHPGGAAHPARAGGRGAIRAADAVVVRRSARGCRAALRGDRGTRRGPWPSRGARGARPRAVATALEGDARACGTARPSGLHHASAAGALEGRRRAPPGEVAHRGRVTFSLFFLWPDRRRASLSPMVTRNVERFATPVRRVLKGRLSSPQLHPDLERFA